MIIVGNSFSFNQLSINRLIAKALGIRQYNALTASNCVIIKIQELQSYMKTLSAGTLCRSSSESQCAQTGSTQPASSQQTLCRTAPLTWGGWKKLLAFLCTVLKGNCLFMGPVLLEMALFCPVIVLYPSVPHQYALFTICCNTPAPIVIKEKSWIDSNISKTK